MIRDTTPRMCKPFEARRQELERAVREDGCVPEEFRLALSDPRLRLFFVTVAARLDAGDRQSGNHTFELPASRINAEAQDELLDNAAYSFIA